MRWYLAVLKNYAVFSGRARRKEYWLFGLFNVMITLVLAAIDGSAGLINADGLGPLSGFYILATFIPGLAVSVRRLHDTDHSGWWLLIALVPFFGPIALLVFMVRDGQPCYNHFGPDPKETATPSRPSILTPTPESVGS
jgi:uncharacterized membrane protein YhaH (DUF805 family)